MAAGTRKPIGADIGAIEIDRADPGLLDGLLLLAELTRVKHADCVPSAGALLDQRAMKLSACTVGVIFRLGIGGAELARRRRGGKRRRGGRQDRRRLEEIRVRNEGHDPVSVVKQPAPGRQYSVPLKAVNRDGLAGGERSVMV